MLIIYGGSFNPPTVAHYKIAKELLNYYTNSHLVFLPVGDYYQKDQLVSATHRINMLSFITKKLKRCSVSNYEVTKNQFSGTYETLKYFKQQSNEALYYVIGADNLSGLTKWINYEKLLSEFNFIVIPRDEFHLSTIFSEHPRLKQYSKSINFFDQFTKINSASSQYRSTSQLNNVVLDEINNYIYKHQLYDRRGESYEK